jgi:hypothetical protein
MRATTTISDDGIGFTESMLADERECRRESHRYQLQREAQAMWSPRKPAMS